MHTGWIKLYRCLLADPVWQCGTSEQKVILVTLLLMANHAEKKWQWQGRPYLCRPGQMITSAKSIAQKAGPNISRQNVRTTLKRLEKLGFLTMQTTTLHTLITICNWDTYQVNEASPNQAANHPVTNAPPRPNQHLTTNKNDKKVKNEKKGRPPASFPLSFEQQDIQRAKATNTKAMAAFMQGGGKPDE